MFLVTTKVDRIPHNRKIVMLDGTVPGWEPKDGDKHYDHHRPGGKPIQILEIPDNEGWDGKEKITVVTTQLDADAVIAAAYFFCDKQEGLGKETKDKLEAIAWDCDYLGVPPHLSHLADFAAQAVATMKSVSPSLISDLCLPKDKETWSEEQYELFYSARFEESTEWILAAIAGQCEFPGENGEAAEYWKQVEADTEMLIQEERIEFYKGCAIAHIEDIPRYVDPRSINAAIFKLKMPELAITLTARTRKDKTGKSYTLGTLTQHPQALQNNYPEWKVFEALSEIEKERNPNFQGWGGRTIVGGSSWNDPSLLSSHEIIDCVIALRQSSPLLR